jgi:hypothetical protein
VTGKKPTKAERDAAYMKTEGLRGQIDAFDGIQGAENDRAVIEDYGKSAPEICPHCQTKAMHFPAGGLWTHLKVWDQGHRLQCNNCGGIVSVTEQVWIDVRELAIRTFVDRSPNKAVYEKRKGMLKRQRGAE